MTVLEIFLTTLYTLILIAAFGVIFSKNSLFSILFLALIFILTAILFFCVGAEFIAILLLVIYSGAMILLFLFIIFLLNLRNVELYNSHTSQLPIGLTISCFFLATIYSICVAELENSIWEIFTFHQWKDIISPNGNLSLFGWVLYEHAELFILGIATLLLGVMCGVIVLSTDLKEKRYKKSYTQRITRNTTKNQSTSFWLSTGRTISHPSVKKPNKNF